jgi:hypothetical protein
MPLFVLRKRLVRLLFDGGCSAEMNSETNRVELTGDSCTCHAEESEQEYVIPVGSWKLEPCSSARVP